MSLAYSIIFIIIEKELNREGFIPFFYFIYLINKLNKIKMTAENVAQLAHESCKVLKHIQGDFSETTWESTEQSQKDEEIQKVKTISSAPETTAEELHKAWALPKYADGWSYGPVKDVAAKEDPALVHYDKLSLNQQEVHKLFIGIVKSATVDIPSTTASQQ